LSFHIVGENSEIGELLTNVLTFSWTSLISVY